MRTKLQNKKGFTLAELLIVVAIIAVLVAVSIPVFASQLENSRESADAANLRAAYAEVMSAALTEEDSAGVTVNKTDDKITTITADVKCGQKEKTWTNTKIEDIGGVEISGIPATKLTGWTITYTASTQAVTFTEQ